MRNCVPRYCGRRLCGYAHIAVSSARHPLPLICSTPSQPKDHTPDGHFGLDNHAPAVVPLTFHILQDSQMAATVAHQTCTVPATVGHAGASRSLDKSQAAGGVVVPGAPSEASNTSRKLRLDDFAKVRTLGTGRWCIRLRSGWWVRSCLSLALPSQAHSPESCSSGYRIPRTRQNGTKSLRSRYYEKPKVREVHLPPFFHPHLADPREQSSNSSKLTMSGTSGRSSATSAATPTSPI